MLFPLPPRQTRKKISQNFWPFVLLYLWQQKKRWLLPNFPTNKLTKQLAFCACLYHYLQQKYPPSQAEEIIKEIIFFFGEREQKKFISSEPDPLKRLKIFLQKMAQKGPARYNKIANLSFNSNGCYFEVKKCLFFDFFSAQKMPELVPFFCQTDNLIAQKYFPEFSFSHGPEDKTTLARGAARCEFIFLLKRKKRLLAE